MPAAASSTKYAPACFRPASEGGSAGPAHSASATAARIATGAASERSAGVVLKSTLGEDALQDLDQSRNVFTRGPKDLEVVDLAVLVRERVALPVDLLPRNV